MPHPEFPTLHVLDHPLITHKLSVMRDKNTPTVLFRLLLKEISMLMGYEITRPLVLAKKPIETPLTKMDAPFLDERDVAIVSILRAGLGMSEGVHELMPTAREGHIGLYRDAETKRPVEYYVKLPSPSARPYILVDPMLATGYSAAAAVDVLNKHGVVDKDIRMMTLVCAREGVRVFRKAHPGLPIYTAALGDSRNGHAYIGPGLGDAGDRLFGTK